MSRVEEWRVVYGVWNETKEGRNALLKWAKVPEKEISEPHPCWLCLGLFLGLESQNSHAQMGVQGTVVDLAVVSTGVMSHVHEHTCALSDTTPLRVQKFLEHDLCGLGQLCSFVPLPLAGAFDPFFARSSGRIRI